MRTAYFLSSYLYFNTITSPSREWVNKQMFEQGIDVGEHTEFTTMRIFLMAVFLAGIIIGELTSHRFFISQTSEESKYPWKPQRCLMTLWVMIIVIWMYPDNRFIHIVFIACLQRVTINHLYIIQVQMLSMKNLMYFIVPYIIGYVFRVLFFWYNMYCGLLLVTHLFYQGATEKNIWKILCGLLYTSSAVCYYLALEKG